MEEQIKDIMTRVFQVERSEITAEVGPNSIDGWDSAAHMQLVMTLEDELGVEIDDDDIPKMISLEEIVRCSQKQKHANVGDA